MEKLKFFLALLVLGAVSLIAQMILVRELLAGFYGNELFVSLVLAFWLLSTGSGSLFFAEFFKIKFNGRISWFFFLTPLVFSLSFILARLSRVVLGAEGAAPNMIMSSLWSLLTIFPSGLIIGALFVFIAQELGHDTKEKNVSLAYAIESLGFFFAAICFNFFLFDMSGLGVVFLVAILIFTALFFLKIKNLYLTPIFILAIIVSVFCLGQAGDWSKQLDHWRYLKEEVITSANTKYGSVEITRTPDQINFYRNGSLTDSSLKYLHNETMIHLPMAAVFEPESSLVIGNGFTGIIDELKKYGPQRIVYLEMDEVYLSEAAKAGFPEPEDVEIIDQDAYEYLRNNKEKFDLVVINYTDPSTFYGNRYFSQEMFSAIRKNMSAKGILALGLGEDSDRLVGDFEDVSNMIYKTLKGSFPWVTVLPDEEILFLASPTRPEIDWKAVTKRSEDLGLNDLYYTPELIKWRFWSDSSEAENARLQTALNKINSFLKPSLYYEYLRISLRESRAGNFFGWLMISIVFLLSIGLFLVRGKGKEAIFLLFISASIEFSLLAFEVILILIFQAFHGHFYGQLSLLISLILVGVSLGSLFSLFLLDRVPATKLLKIFTFLIFLAFSFFLVIVWKFEYLLEYTGIYWVLSFSISLAVGTKFPVINKLYLKEGSRLGAIYGIDLFGASIGAIAASIIIIPIFGMVSGLLFLSLLCLAAFSVSMDFD